MFQTTPNWTEALSELSSVRPVSLSINSEISYNSNHPGSKVTGLIIGNKERAGFDRDELSLATAVSMAFVPSDDADVDQILEKLDYELSH